MAERMPEDTRRQQLLASAFAVACREGIGGVTVRAVAAEANVSHGLVLFHFQRKDRLVRELLDWLIETSSALHVSADVANFPRSLDQLHALLQQEMTRLSHQPEHTRLFLEYWALGAQHDAIRARIGAELARYRAAFRTIMEEVIQADPNAHSRVTADGLAAVAVSLIHGCAVQAMVDPERFDTDEYLAAVRRMISELA